MKIYLVENSNHVVLAVFKKKKKAEDFIKEFGVKIWKETWTIKNLKTNHIQNWLKHK